MSVVDGREVDRVARGGRLRVEVDPPRGGHRRPRWRRGHHVTRRRRRLNLLAPLSRRRDEFLARRFALLPRRLERLAGQSQFGVGVGSERLELLPLPLTPRVVSDVLIDEPLGERRELCIVVDPNGDGLRGSGLRGSEELAVQSLPGLAHGDPVALQLPRLELKPLLRGCRRGLGRGGDRLEPLSLGAKPDQLSLLIGDPFGPLALAIRLLRRGFSRHGRRGPAHFFPLLHRGLRGDRRGLEGRQARLAGGHGRELPRRGGLALLHGPPALLNRQPLPLQRLRLDHVLLPSLLQLSDRVPRVSLRLFAALTRGGGVLRRGPQLVLRAAPVRRRLGQLRLELPRSRVDPRALRAQLGFLALEPRGRLLEPCAALLGVLLSLRHALGVREHRRGFAPVGSRLLREGLRVVPRSLRRGFVPLDRRQPLLELRVVGCEGLDLCVGVAFASLGGG